MIFGRILRSGTGNILTYFNYIFEPETDIFWRLSVFSGARILKSGTGNILSFFGTEKYLNLYAKDIIVMDNSH